MAEKPEKDFMTMFKNIKRRLAIVIVAALPVLNGCEPELVDDPIPFLSFSPIVLNLNLPEYVKLRSDGGSMVIEGGIRGIILFRQSATTYQAYERNCSYQPNNACANVEIDLSALFMIDHCCSSTFDFVTGKPTGGPAWRPLQRYETILNGSELTITDTIAE